MHFLTSPRSADSTPQILRRTDVVYTRSVPRRCEPCRLSLLSEGLCRVQTCFQQQRMECLPISILRLSVARTHCCACVRPQSAIGVYELLTTGSHAQHNLRELFPPLLSDQLSGHLWWCVGNDSGSRKFWQFDIDCQPSVTLRSNCDRALAGFEFRSDPEFASALTNIACSRANHKIMASSPISFTSAPRLLQPDDAATRCVELCLLVQTSR